MKIVDFGYVSRRPARQVWQMAKLAPTVVLAVSLAGCLVPEKFVASVDVRPDGAYTYKYDGTAIEILAAAQIAKVGKLSDKDEDKLKADVDKALKNPSFKKLAYLGRGKYDIQIEEVRSLGQQISTLPVLTVTKGKDGAIVIAGQALKEKEKSDLASVGIKMDGSLEVRLPSNAKVLETNATGTPGFFSKAYSWKIGGVDKQPIIKFTLN